MFSFRRLISPVWLKQRNLAVGRLPISKERFVSAVSSTELGRVAAWMLWEKLRHEVVYDGFTPYPDDDLLKVFALAEEDLDEDIILEIISATGSIIPDSDMLCCFGAVKTPYDIIRLIEESNP